MEYNNLMRVYAEKMLDLAIKHNKIESYVSGEPPLKITAVTEDGKKINNSMLVMKCIYKKHLKNKELELDKKVYDAMMKVLKTRNHEDLVLNVLRNIEYHIFLQNEGVAPFEMDCAELLKEAKNNIIRNKNRFENDKYGMWTDLENINEAFENNYGHKIL